MLKQYTIKEKLMTLADYIEHEMTDFDVAPYSNCFCAAWNRKFRAEEGYKFTDIPDRNGFNTDQSAVNLICPTDRYEHSNRRNRTLAANTLRRFAAGEYISENWLDDEQDSASAISNG